MSKNKTFRSSDISSKEKSYLCQYVRWRIRIGGGCIAKADRISLAPSSLGPKNIFVIEKKNRDFALYPTERRDTSSLGRDWSRGFHARLKKMERFYKKRSFKGPRNRFSGPRIGWKRIAFVDFSLLVINWLTFQRVSSMLESNFRDNIFGEARICLIENVTRIKKRERGILLCLFLRNCKFRFNTRWLRNVITFIS